MKFFVCFAILGIVFSIQNTKFGYASESTASDEYAHKPYQTTTNDNQATRSLRAGKVEGYSYDPWRDVIANCSKSMSETFGFGPYEAAFSQAFTSNFMTQEAAFPPGAEFAVAAFCEAMTKGIDSFMATSQKMMSMTNFNPFGAFFNMTSNSQPFSQHTSRNVAESLLASLAAGGGEFATNSEPHNRNLQEFVSEAQNVIQQLGKNIGSMFGMGPFDEAMANSFLAGFLNTIGSNSDVVGVLTEVVDGVVRNPMNTAAIMQQIPTPMNTIF